MQCAGALGFTQSRDLWKLVINGKPGECGGGSWAGLANFTTFACLPLRDDDLTESCTSMWLVLSDGQVRVQGGASWSNCLSALLHAVYQTSLPLLLSFITKKWDSVSNTSSLGVHPKGRERDPGMPGSGPVHCLCCLWQNLGGSIYIRK